MGSRVRVLPVALRRGDCEARSVPVPREPRQLALEIRFDRQPIEGRLYAEEGEPVRPFSGWLGMMAAIQAAGGEAINDRTNHAGPTSSPGGAETR